MANLLFLVLLLVQSKACGVKLRHGQKGLDSLCAFTPSVPVALSVTERDGAE
jgi:hypothetical protein